jgi:hypothetical protein
MGGVERRAKSTIKSNNFFRRELLKGMCNPARQRLAGLTDTGSQSTHVEAYFSIPCSMHPLAAEPQSDQGRGAYDTTGVAKPPPRPRPS